MADPIRDLIDRVVELVFLIEVEFENDYMVVNPAGEERGVEEAFRDHVAPVKKAIETVEQLLAPSVDLPQASEEETFAFLRGDPFP